MAKNLLIVESPAKAKTIEAILGKDFQVKSCFGHIRDLEKNDMGIDINNNFLPKYIISPDKTKVVSDLKALAKKADEVWLASDEDREGESISWHLAEVLKLDPKTTKRIVFHEITKPAIDRAVKNPRTINMDLVDAQQARRVLDRIVGFELSPILWRKMSMRNNLSAGRVQSVAVRIIAEREREINAFVPLSSFRVDAFFTAKDIQGKKVTFKAERSKQSSEVNAEKFLQSCLGAAYTVADIQVKPSKKTPSAPFTTSTLQQEASRKLGFAPAHTMRIAQRLYEGIDIGGETTGLITYMRTDGVQIDGSAITQARKVIGEDYGNAYVPDAPRQYQTKAKNAQEAHEAIRPTDLSRRPARAVLTALTVALAVLGQPLDLGHEVGGIGLRQGDDAEPRVAVGHEREPVAGNDLPLEADRVEHRVRDLEEAGNIRAIDVVARRAETLRGRATGLVNRLHDSLQARIHLFARPREAHAVLRHLEPNSPLGLWLTCCGRARVSCRSSAFPARSSGRASACHRAGSQTANCQLRVSAATTAGDSASI